ncbi:hypothetical protein LTSEURB_2811 [Salmonella enterica subsp. enterica serovar Urbana str. R8-2977]|uniref:Uncharacterized protein n=1 Tax=Salmonella enterica subsp. enterica serovar Urbana str. R8-2977 TaxID=913084 RepID=G5RWC4_SALET|nr:hypothetical protein LTSEJOH_3056 [Salmonella enterica subsp. enterica serovar Johannesburg str. S5-703]EHD03021.1 hypothetical protein LTSEURB_2811 [Salmonella enterica subsp. enterica serovar Urbana str. R8-2977]
MSGQSFKKWCILNMRYYSLHPPVDVVPDGQISVEAGYIPHAMFL